MRRRLQLAVSALVFLGFASACASSPGASQPTANDPTSAAATPSKHAVNRPRQLRLNGIDPCSTLSASQQAHFQTHGPKSGTDEATQSPDCDFHLAGGTYRVTLVTNAGVDSWTSGSSAANAQPPAPISGFPTFSSQRGQGPGFCDVVVDTADGQYLDVSAQVLPGYESKMPDTCSSAHQVAEAAMQTLLGGH